MLSCRYIVCRSSSGTAQLLNCWSGSRRHPERHQTGLIGQLFPRPSARKIFSRFAGWCFRRKRVLGLKISQNVNVQHYAGSESRGPFRGKAGEPGWAGFECNQWNLLWREGYMSRILMLKLRFSRHVYRRHCTGLGFHHKGLEKCVVLWL